MRPHFDYCDTLFHIPHLQNGALNALMSKIESIQYQAALAITGTWKGTSRLRLYEELGWESLSERRCTNRVIQIFKIANDFTPPYLKDRLPPFRLQALRNGNPNLLTEKHAITDTYRNSFFPNAIYLWNKCVRHITETAHATR